MKLETERLILRGYSRKDIPDLIKNVNNIKIARMVSSIPHPYTNKDADYWIDKCQKNARKKKRESYEFAIGLKPENNLIGGIGLFGIHKQNETGELGCWLGEDYWRQGIMSEAARRLISFAFNELKLRKLGWKAYTNNKASNALAKKLRFKLEGVLRKDVKCLATGKIHDINVYGLLR